MSHIQALIFSKEKFTRRQVNNWLVRNNIQKLKPIHTTFKTYRVRLLQPNYNKYYYRTGTLQQGLKCVYEFAK